MLMPSEHDQRRQVSVEQAEEDYFAEVRHALNPLSNRERQELAKSVAESMQRPFGVQNAKWEALKALIQLGDELHEFRIGWSSWTDRLDVAGYELRRAGVVIATIVTLRNGPRPSAVG